MRHRRTEIMTQGVPKRSGTPKGMGMKTILLLLTVLLFIGCNTQTQRPLTTDEYREGMVMGATTGAVYSSRLICGRHEECKTLGKSLAKVAVTQIASISDADIANMTRNDPTVKGAMRIGVAIYSKEVFLPSCEKLNDSYIDCNTVNQSVIEQSEMLIHSLTDENIEGIKG